MMCGIHKPAKSRRGREQRLSRFLIAIFFSGATAENFILAPRSGPINILLVIDCRMYITLHSRRYLRAPRHVPLDCITNVIEKCSSGRLPYTFRRSNVEARENYSPITYHCPRDVCFTVPLNIGCAGWNAFLSGCVKIFTYNSLASRTKSRINTFYITLITCNLAITCSVSCFFPSKLEWPSDRAWRNQRKENIQSFTLNGFTYLSLDFEKASTINSENADRVSV